MLQNSEINELSNSMLKDMYKYILTDSENIRTLPLTTLQNTTVSTTRSSPGMDQITSSFMSRFSDPTPTNNCKTTTNP